MRLESYSAYMGEGQLELVAGNPEAAERALRIGFDFFQSLGERGFNSTLTAHLANAVYQQGRLDEAMEFTRVSEELAAADDIVSQALWRSVRGKVLAAQGAVEEGERLAREGVAITDRTDSIVMQGDARVALAEVLSRSGRTAEAKALLKEALGLYEAKGAVPHIAAAHRRLAELESPGL
jgi:tetratricopeptide (TPR) repeat protein